MRRVVLSLVLVGLGCDEDPLSQVHPRISVCPAADSPAESCDRPFQLGELPIARTARRTLFVHNRGTGALHLSALREQSSALTSSTSLPLIVPSGGQRPIDLLVTPTDLGAGRLAIVAESDDPERPSHPIELELVGRPTPVPRIALCVGEGASGCGTDVALDFGEVRRSQVEARTVQVQNTGEEELEIRRVWTIGRSSVPSELSVLTSTRSGRIAPGGSAPVALSYRPEDAGPDELELRFASNDPAVPEAMVRVRGRSAANEPPRAEAVHAPTGATRATVTVGDEVALDGRGSRDPEGDPLAFRWRMEGPDGSRAALDDPDAGVVIFAPDVAGAYRVELVVTDSLGQSGLAAVVELEARVRHALRATLSWPAGGDLDLHLAPADAPLFSAEDCYFENRRPDLGQPGRPDDDPELVRDSTTAPGLEDIVLIAPAPGRYRLYVHHFEANGPVDATVRVAFDDAAQPSHQATLRLLEACDLWTVGDLVFPERRFVPIDAQSRRCP